MYAVYYGIDCHVAAELEAKLRRTMRQADRKVSADCAGHDILRHYVSTGGLSASERCTYSCSHCAVRWTELQERDIFSY